MQSTVLQIFMKVLNITFFPITLYSSQFMIYAKTKPNNGLSGAAFSWAFFFRFVAYQPHQFCQIACANNQQVEKLKQLVHCSLLEKFPTHQHLGLCCIYCAFVPFRIQTYQCSRWRCLFVRYFFFRMCSLSTASTLPNFVRKQATIWKIRNIGTIFVAW